MSHSIRGKAGRDMMGFSMKGRSLFILYLLVRISFPFSDHLCKPPNIPSQSYTINKKLPGECEILVSICIYYNFPWLSNEQRLNLLAGKPPSKSIQSGEEVQKNPVLKWIIDPLEMYTIKYSVVKFLLLFVWKKNSAKIEDRMGKCDGKWDV